MYVRVAIRYKPNAIDGRCWESCHALVCGQTVSRPACQKIRNVLRGRATASLLSTYVREHSGMSAVIQLQWRLKGSMVLSPAPIRGRYSSVELAYTKLVGKIISLVTDIIHVQMHSSRCTSERISSAGTYRHRFSVATGPGSNTKLQHMQHYERFLRTCSLNAVKRFRCWENSPF